MYALFIMHVSPTMALEGDDFPLPSSAFHLTCEMACSLKCTFLNNFPILWHHPGAFSKLPREGTVLMSVYKMLPKQVRFQLMCGFLLSVHVNLF